MCANYATPVGNYSNINKRLPHSPTTSLRLLLVVLRDMIRQM